MTVALIFEHLCVCVCVSLIFEHLCRVDTRKRQPHMGGWL